MITIDSSGDSDWIMGNLEKFPAVWYCLVAARFLWVLLPQSGYIHPDEFFQTSEIIAGDVLNLEVNRPWEFDNERPIRSIALQYTLLGPPYLLLEHMKKTLFPGALSPPSYYMIVAPRLVMTSLSIFMDILLGRIAINLNINLRSSVLCFATSFVTFVHLTRTFTNSLEAFLFTLLLYCCTKPSNRECRSELAASLDNAVLSLTLVAGFFNRPTFGAFALIPLMYWLIKRGITKRKIFECFSCGLTSVFIFIAADTLHFRNMTLSDLCKDFTSNFALNKLRITPYHWLLYNMDPMNLADHGLHSRFTHLLVNMPMLFGPCAIIFGTFLILVILKRDVCNQQTNLLLTTLCPVLCLSLFPHQEARFLVPLITPIALLCGTTVYARKFPWRLLRITWIVFNIFGAVVFGVLHQGGVTRSLSLIQGRLNQEIESNGRLLEEKHLIYYHTYMPPLHLLSKPASNGNPTDLMHIHDLKGGSLQSLKDLVSTTKHLTHNDKQFILVTPAVTLQELCQSDLKVTDIYRVWPHVSFEHLPDFGALWTKDGYFDGKCASVKSSFLNRLSESLSLYILHVQDV